MNVCTVHAMWCGMRLRCGKQTFIIILMLAKELLWSRIYKCTFVRACMNNLFAAIFTPSPCWIRQKIVSNKRGT